MKKIIFIAVLILAAFLIKHEVYSQTIYDFNTGIAEAKRANKPILINIYKESSSWYNKMEENVYSNEKVKNLLDNFVYVKLDVNGSQVYKFNDKDYSASDLASFLGSTGYPTHVLMTSDGKVIAFKYNEEEVRSFPGYIDPENFVEFLEYFYEGKYKYSDLNTIFQN